MKMTIKNWSVMQDVHDLGRELKIYSGTVDPYSYSHLMSPWEKLERLTYLQKVYSETPYHGRALRQFNAAPWWYRAAFDLSPESGTTYILHFPMIDYYGDVWLNGSFCGHHEGYQEAFEIDVTGLLRAGTNELYVRVASPWDMEILKGCADKRFFSVKRNLVKGTYEHADGFIQRDVNPIGIVGDVMLEAYTGGRIVSASVRGDAEGRMELRAVCAHAAPGTKLRISVADPNGAPVAELTASADSEIALSETIPSPRLWWTWDRGESALYAACIELTTPDGTVSDRRTLRFGFNTTELLRTPEETVYKLNGKRLFLRGTAYFPDVYFADLSRDRLRRDVLLMRQAGFNAVRVHVHIEPDAFYDICDELGMLVFQDTDFSWCHPTEDAEWIERGVKLFERVVERLKRHASLGCWILLNEPDKWKTSIVTNGGCSLTEIISQPDSVSRAIGLPLRDAVRRLDPAHPYIRASYNEDDPESGDSHNYLGSLRGEKTQYTEIRGTKEKLVTEFGMDVPGNVQELYRDRAVYEALRPVEEKLAELGLYQYKLLKYYIEHYRCQKYAPCSGYFQFMFIDLCPQSFYGVLDYWGVPKMGWTAIEESNAPLAVMACLPEEGDSREAEIILVNDGETCYSGTVYWSLTQNGRVTRSGNRHAEVGADGRTICGRLPEIEPAEDTELRLVFRGDNGRTLCTNSYLAPFYEPKHVEGHPSEINSELGVRIYRRP